MEKLCPLCGKTEWNYDIIINLSGLCFCRDCWHDVKQEVYKLGWNYFLNGPMNKTLYNKALRMAKKNLVKV